MAKKADSSSLLESLLFYGALYAIPFSSLYFSRVIRGPLWHHHWVYCWGFFGLLQNGGPSEEKNICFAKYLLNALHPCMFHVIALKKSAPLKNANMHFWHLNTILNVRVKMQWGYYFPLQIRRFIICWYILVDPEGNDIHTWNLFFCQSKRYCTDDTLNLSIPSNTNQILVTVWYVKAQDFHKVYSSSMNLFRKIRFHFMNQATVNYIK